MEVIAARGCCQRMQQKLTRKRLARHHELFPHLKVLPGLLLRPGRCARSQRRQRRAPMLMTSDAAGVTRTLREKDGLHSIPKELVIECRPRRRRNRLLSKRK